MMTKVNLLKCHILCKTVGNITTCPNKTIPDLIEIPFKLVSYNNVLKKNYH